MSHCIFELQMKVRDYECDIQGIVNNSNYQRYLEHTRHEFLETLGDSFTGMHQNGYDAMVSRIDLQFKTPLKSGDYFTCKLESITKEGPRWIFLQKIFRNSDNKLCAVGRVEVVVLYKGDLTRGEIFEELLGKDVGVKN